MNKLNELEIANLNPEELKKLQSAEQMINSAKNENEKIYLIAVKSPR